MAQIEGRARLTKDSNLLSSEEYLGLKEEFDNVDAEVSTKVDTVVKQLKQEQRGSKSSNNMNNRRTYDNNNRGNNNQMNGVGGGRQQR